MNINEIIVDNVKKIYLEDGDILVLRDCFSAEYKCLLQKTINEIYPDKKIGVMFVSNPNDMRIIKLKDVTFKTD